MNLAGRIPAGLPLLLMLACGDDTTAPIQRPGTEREVLDRGAVRLLIDNRGLIAHDLASGQGVGFFPRDTPNNYLFSAGLWVGAIRDGIPVVSTTLDEGALAEFVPGRVAATGGGGDRILCWSRPEDRVAWYPEFSDPARGPVRIGDDDCVVIFNDANPQLDVTTPFGVEVHQRASAFTTGLQSQAILFTWEVLNTSAATLQEAFAAVFVDADLGPFPFNDDRCSAILAVPPGGNNSTGLTLSTNLGFCWDHEFQEEAFDPSPPGFVGVTFLRAPQEVPRALTRFTLTLDPSIGTPDRFTTDRSQYELLAGADFRIPFIHDQPTDQRFVAIAGPFTLAPGDRRTLAAAFLWADVSVPIESLAVDPERCFPEGAPCFLPDPNDPALAELIAVQQAVQQLVDEQLPPP